MGRGLVSSLALTSLKGDEGLSHLYSVSTLEEGPTLGALSMSKHLGQSRALVPTPMERPV